MAILPTDYTDATTPTGATTELPATTSRGLNAINTQINTNTTDIANKADLYGPILTDPLINAIKGHTTGLDVIRFIDNASAVNYLRIGNRVAGAPPTLEAYGSDTNVSFAITPKGTGAFYWYQPAGSEMPFIVDGGATDVDCNFYPKNAGKLKVNSVAVATVSDIQTLTNKTVTGLATTDGIAAVNLPNGITNGNTSQQSQAVVSGTSYYITGSNLNLPATLKAGMAVGTRFRWRVAMAKTAAGTGAFAIEIRRGTNGTTADTADVSQSVGTQTAVIDNMVVDIEVAVTATGATGSYYWTIIPVNTISSLTTAAGFGVPKHTAALFSGTVSSVAMNTTSLKFGLSFKATTGTPTITIPMVQAQALNIC